MKRISVHSLFLSILIIFVACQKSDSPDPLPSCPTSSAYYVLKVKGVESLGKILLPVDSYQQTTEYTCGPAAVLSVLRFYGKEGDEMTIAKEMGTSTTTGTTPEQMTTWLNSHGFQASWHEQGTLEMLRENLAKWYDALLFGKVMKKIYIELK